MALELLVWLWHHTLCSGVLIVVPAARRPRSSWRRFEGRCGTCPYSAGVWGREVRARPDRFVTTREARRGR